MWVPTSEEEIRAALESGTVIEGPAFDAKASLPEPGKNKDLAKDICAMTVDGGVLLYGVSGDDPTRPNQLLPFELSGASERIDQVAQTAIAEAPETVIHDIASSDRPGAGYLAVEIPASPRAPHMVTAGGENRYWGRGATGNRRLEEGEIARLYERRERWEIDRGARLAEEIRAMPFEFSDPIDLVGPMVVIASPVAVGRDLLRQAAGREDVRAYFQRELPRQGREIDPYPGQGSPGIGETTHVAPAGAGRWVFMRDADTTRAYQARVELRPDGTLVYWHAPTLNKLLGEGGSRPLLLEQSVTRAGHQGLGCAGFVLGRAGYNGAVDVGVGILAIGSAIGASARQNFLGTAQTLGSSEFRATERVALARDLLDPRALVVSVLRPLFDAISVTGYDPYEASSVTAS